MIYIYQNKDKGLNIYLVSNGSVTLRKDIAVTVINLIEISKIKNQPNGYY